MLATKYFYEIGSAESRQPSRRFRDGLIETIRQHSLTIFLVLTGVGWTLLYLKMDPEGKWGQVIGNIVSEWTQLLGLVLLTKRLIERKIEGEQAVALQLPQFDRPLKTGGRFSKAVCRQWPHGHGDGVADAGRLVGRNPVFPNGRLTEPRVRHS